MQDCFNVLGFEREKIIIVLKYKDLSFFNSIIKVIR